MATKIAISISYFMGKAFIFTLNLADYFSTLWPDFVNPQ